MKERTKKILEILIEHSHHVPNSVDVRAIYDTDFKALSAEIESLKEEREENWINVNDRLPETDKVWDGIMLYGWNKNRFNQEIINLMEKNKGPFNPPNICTTCLGWRSHPPLKANSKKCECVEKEEKDKREGEQSVIFSDIMAKDYLKDPK